MTDPLIAEVLETVYSRLYDIRKHGGRYETMPDIEVGKMTDQELRDRAAMLVEGALVDLALRYGGHST